MTVGTAGAGAPGGGAAMCVGFAERACVFVRAHTLRACVHSVRRRRVGEGGGRNRWNRCNRVTQAIALYAVAVSEAHADYLWLGRTRAGVL